jgi:hypothetical protein
MNRARPRTNPAAFAVMGHNRARDIAEDREVERLTQAQDLVAHVVALTALVEQLQERIEQLEGTIT